MFENIDAILTRRDTSSYFINTVVFLANNILILKYRCTMLQNDESLACYCPSHCLRKKTPRGDEPGALEPRFR